MRALGNRIDDRGSDIVELGNRIDDRGAEIVDSAQPGRRDRRRADQRAAGTGARDPDDDPAGGRDRSLRKAGRPAPRRRHASPPGRSWPAAAGDGPAADAPHAQGLERRQVGAELAERFGASAREVPAEISRRACSRSSERPTDSAAATRPSFRYQTLNSPLLDAAAHDLPIPVVRGTDVLERGPVGEVGEEVRDYVVGLVARRAC